MCVPRCRSFPSQAVPESVGTPRSKAPHLIRQAVLNQILAFLGAYPVFAHRPGEGGFRSSRSRSRAIFARRRYGCHSPRRCHWLRCHSRLPNRQGEEWHSAARRSSSASGRRARQGCSASCFIAFFTSMVRAAGSAAITSPELLFAPGGKEVIACLDRAVLRRVVVSIDGRSFSSELLFRKPLAKLQPGNGGLRHPGAPSSERSFPFGRIPTISPCPHARANPEREQGATARDCSPLRSLGSRWDIPGQRLRTMCRHSLLVNGAHDFVAGRGVL